MSKSKRKNALDRKSNAKKTLILSRVFNYYVRESEIKFSRQPLLLVMLKHSKPKNKGGMENLAIQTAQEFINVRDIRDKYLYTTNGLILTFVRIHSISIDLDSKAEKNSLIRQLTAELSDIQYPSKFLAVSRPVDISPVITDMQRAVLKKCLIELYQTFSIDWETDFSLLKAEDFPVFSDLYQLIQKRAEEEIDRQVYVDLAMLLYDIAEGSDSFIWNGKSSIKDSTGEGNSNGSIIVLDTNALQETSDHIKRTQYFNILTWCWEQMSRNREERVLLICDEVYLMIDQKVPQSLVYLRNVMKRARKYEGALAIISHSIVDFLSESIRQYGQALLDIPCYKVLMGTDGKNLKETADLYDLTEAEQELLLARKRGHALFMVGAKRLHINFEIPEYKLLYMGRAGGR